jgi:hypothetical protein
MDLVAQEITLGKKAVRLKKIKLTKIRVIFNDCHRESNLVFQPKIMKLQWTKTNK